MNFLRNRFKYTRVRSNSDEFVQTSDELDQTRETKRNTELPRDAPAFMRNTDALLKAFESANTRHRYFDLVYTVFSKEERKAGIGPENPRLRVLYGKCLRELDNIGVARPRLLDD